MTEIKAPDGSISAKFVSVGATLTELWVKDRDGKARDVVLGYDDNVLPFFWAFAKEETQTFCRLNC